MEHTHGRGAIASSGSPDRGDIVLGWLTKLVVVLGILGVAGFDGISIAQANFQASDRAGTAARAAAENYQTSKNIQQAYDAAFATLTGDDTIETKTFAISQDGAVSLLLKHRAVTLVVHRIGPLAPQADVSAIGEARAAR